MRHVLQEKLFASSAIQTLGWSILAGALAFFLCVYRELNLIPLDGNPLYVVTFTACLLVFGSATVSRFSSLEGATHLFLFFFVIRLLLCVFLGHVVQYDDERFFHAVGLTQQYGIRGMDGNGFYHLINLLYWQMGPGLLFPKLVNICFGSLLPFLVAEVAHRLLESPAVARRALLLAAFFPPLLIYSCLNLKELLTAFGMVLSLRSLPDGKIKIRNAVGIALSLLFLYWLRGLIWTMPAVVGVSAFFVSRLVRPFLLGRRFDFHSGAALVVGIGLLIWLAPIIQAKVLFRLSQEVYFIRNFQQSTAGVMSLVDKAAVFSWRNVTVLFFRGLFSPSPFRFIFDWAGSTLIEALNSASWYLIFPFFLIGLLSKWRDDFSFAAGVTVLGILLLSNMMFLGGDPYRHRTISLGILLAVAAVGLERPIWQRYRWVLGGWWAASFVFTLLWVGYRA